MNPLDLTGLSRLMARTIGIPDVVIALIDGPVAEGLMDLNRENLRGVGGRTYACSNRDSMACRHGTFIAAILNAKRSSVAPALCPGCTLLIRPVFCEFEGRDDQLPDATPVELAEAIIESVDQGARIINLSVALEEPSPEGDPRLEDALDYAERKRIIVTAAAGNRGNLGGSVLTRHRWVIPVAACDLRGRPVPYSNVAGSIARKGLMAPGEKITSIGSNGQRKNIGGTSTATAFVTGAIALVWSASPRSSAEEIKSAITGSLLRRGRSMVPPLLNAWEAYQTIRGNVIGPKRFKKRVA